MRSTTFINLANPVVKITLAMAFACQIVSAQTRQENTQTYSIASGSLSDSLTEFGDQSGIKLILNADLTRGLKSNALSGIYTIDQGLKKLLKDSGLVYRVIDSNTIIIEPNSDESSSQPQSSTTLPAIRVVGQAQYDATDPYNQDYVLPNATAGTKTDTPIMETPLNVQVISKQVLKDQQVITLADSLKNVSGLTSSTQGGSGNYISGSGGTNTNITLRGFASETFFRNGFRLQQGAASREMANVESVEVLKGPAAILYGLVEPGGMVNVITKQPQATPYYALNQQFGSYDTYRTSVDATGPIADNKDLLYRMNMSYQNSGSFQDFVSKEDVFLAPVLTWRISSKTQATFEFEYDHKHQGLGNSFNPYIGGQFNNIPITRNYGEYSPMTTETFFGSMKLTHQFNDDWAIKQNIAVNQQSNIMNNGLFPEFTISNDVAPLLGGPSITGLQVLREQFSTSSQYNTYSTNLDLTGHFNTAFLKHTLLLGGDYYRLNNNTRSRREKSFGGSSLIDAYNPVHPGVLYDLINFNSTDNSSQTDQYGVYAQDQIDLPYDFHVTGGLRYQNIHQDTENRFLGNPSNVPSQSQDAITPRVGILWQPQRWVSLYANYAESFGANTGVVWNASGRFTTVAPTSAEQYEGGIKTEFFDGRLRATLAYFDLTKTNITTGDPNPLHDCGGGVGSCSLAIGAVRSRGPELDIQGEILPGWNAIATWANVDIIVTETNENKDSLNGINVGDRMINVPRNTGSFWTTYEFQDTDVKGFKFGGGVTLRDASMILGGSNLTTGTLPAIKLPGYATVNLMAAYSRNIGKAKISAQLNIDNLLDKRYYTDGSVSFNDNTFGLYGAYAAYGAPRTVMGSINIQY